MDNDFSHLPYRPCAGIMVVNSDGRIFVGQRLDRDSDAWQMPQGGIDDGEAPRDAALRELWEETGVRADLVQIVTETKGWLTYDLPPDLVPRVWKGRFRGQKQKWFLLRFEGTDSDINIETDMPEFSAWKWVAPEDLLPSIVPFKKEVYAQVLEAFHSHI